MRFLHICLWLFAGLGLVTAGCGGSGVSSPVPETMPTSVTQSPTAVIQPTHAPMIKFTQLRQQQLPHGVINRAALSPEAGLAAAAFRDGGIGLYDLTTFTETDFMALEDQAASLTFSPDGSQLALGLNGEMRLWSIENGRFQPNPLTISDMNSWVEAIVFSPDGSLLAAGIYPKTIRIWHTADNSLVHEIDNGQVSKSLAFSPDGQFLAAGDTDGIIQVWEVENGRLQQTLGEPNDERSVHDWGITALAFSPDGSQLAATTPDNFDTIIWDRGTGKPRQTIQEDTNFVKGYQFSPDGSTLLTIRADAKLWHTQTGELLQTLENPGTFLAAGEFISPDNIVTLNVQGLLRDWGEEDKETSVPTPTHTATLLPTETAVSTSTPVSSPTPEPTQRHILIEDKTRLILEETDGSHHQIAEALEIQDPLWLPDDRHLIFTEWDRREQVGQTTIGLVRTLWLVDADTAQQTLLGKNYHTPQIGPNGRYLAVYIGTDWQDGCSFDRRLRFLQLDSGEMTAGYSLADFEGFPLDFNDEFVPKNGRWASETEFIVEIEAMCEYVEGDNAHAIAHEGVYTFDMAAMTATKLENVSLEPLPIVTATAVYHTKSSFIQWGYYGGDGYDPTDSYYGRMTPQMIIYTDGQMLINQGEWGASTFLETTLTTSEMCALRNQIEATGFLEPQNEADYYTQRDGNEGASNLVVQVEDVLYDFYHPDTPYLVPDLASGLEVIRTVSADHPTDMAYMPETLIIWINEVDETWLSWARYEEEITVDGEWLSRPGSEEKVTIFPWPKDFPPLSDLWADPSQNQITITDDYAPVIYNWFDNTLSERIVRFEDTLYFMIARPLLPHETPDNFSNYPRRPKSHISPINCNNLVIGHG